MCKVDTIPNLNIVYRCAHCDGFAETPFFGLECVDNGLTIVCNICTGHTTIYLLAHPSEHHYENQSVAQTPAQENIK